MAEEIGRFLRQEPIRARPVNAPERVWLWGRRRPALALLLTLVHVVGALGLGGIVWQWRRAERNAASAESRAYGSNMNLAHQALAGNNLGRALELLKRSVVGPGSAGGL